MEKEQLEIIRQAVRNRYGQIAAASGCGCVTLPSCCGEGAGNVTAEQVALALGYSATDLANLPDGANMGLSCGNPKAIAALQPGETVLDLGSGGGFDCFLAAREVGPAGRVIGVDMTAEMLSKARANAAGINAGNVEFRLGEIEHLPVADNSVDVILSNCVINLSPDKPQVYREAFRVLKPGGRLAISDVVATAELPEPLRREMALLTACIAGAESIPGLEAILQATGFQRIRIEPRDASRELIRQWVPGRGLEAYIVSADITAFKPGPPAGGDAR